MSHPLNESFWHNRYLQNQTGWDAGGITTPLKEYFNQLTDPTLRILIPGAGNAWEAGYLHEKGFTNVFVLDLALPPLDNLKRRVPGFPESHLIKGDFFDHQGTYDLIVEQTFFCALDPSLRKKYAEKMASLLRPGGKLAGVLFDTEFEGGPPFGGCADEYRDYFKPRFRFKTFEACHNSISPRTGNELFMILERI